MTETEIDMMKADMDALAYLCRRMLETNEKLRAELREAKAERDGLREENNKLARQSLYTSQSINTQAQFQP